MAVKAALMTAAKIASLVGGAVSGAKAVRSIFKGRKSESDFGLDGGKNRARGSQRPRPATPAPTRPTLLEEQPVLGRARYWEGKG